MKTVVETTATTVRVKEHSPICKLKTMCWALVLFFLIIGCLWFVVSSFTGKSIEPPKEFRKLDEVRLAKLLYYGTKDNESKCQSNFYLPYSNIDLRWKV